MSKQPECGVQRYSPIIETDDLGNRWPEMWKDEDGDWVAWSDSVAYLKSSHKMADAMIAEADRKKPEDT